MLPPPHITFQILRTVSCDAVPNPLRQCVKEGRKAGPAAGYKDLHPTSWLGDVFPATQWVDSE